MNTGLIVDIFHNADSDNFEESLESIYAEEKIKLGFSQRKLSRSDGLFSKDGDDVGIMECKKGKAVALTHKNKIHHLSQIFGYLYKIFKEACNIPKGYILEISTDKYNSYIRVNDKIRHIYAKFKKLYSKYMNLEKVKGIYYSPSYIWKNCPDIKEFMLSIADDIKFTTYNTGEIDYNDFVNELYKKHLAYA